MTPYLAFVAIAGLVALIIRGTSEQKGKFIAISAKERELTWTPYLVCLCVALIFFVSMRDVTVGADTGNYLGSLHYYAGIPWSDVLTAKLVYPYDYEPGYFLLTKICAHFYMSDHVFFLLIAVLIYSPLMEFFGRYSDSPFFSFLIYCALSLFVYSLGIFRQMIALSICLFATRWVDSNKPVFFAIAIGVAMTFHSSAICFALLWFYKRFDVIKLLKIAIPASIVCLIFGRVIALIAVRALPQYAGYIGSKYDVEGGSYTMFMLLLFIAFIVLYALRNKSIFDKCPDVIRLSIFSLGIALCLQGASYSLGIMGRIMSYYTIFLTILVPYLMMHCLGRHGRILSLYFVVPISLVLFVSSLGSVV